MKTFSLSPCSPALDNPAANCLLDEQETRLTLGYWITILQQLQYQLHSQCERPFGYDGTLEMLLQLKAVQQDKDLTLLLPSIPKAKGRALLQAIQRAEVKAVLDELDDRFTADTSLEDIIQSLCIAYSILDLSLQKGGKQRS